MQKLVLNIQLNSNYPSKYLNFNGRLFYPKNSLGLLKNRPSGEELTRLVTLVLFFLSLKRAVGAREGAVLYLRVPHNDGVGGERGNSILRETVQPLPCKTLQRKLSPSS